MNYKSIACIFVFLLSLIFITGCKETPKTGNDKENQKTSATESTGSKVNTDQIIENIKAFRTDCETKLKANKLTRKVIKLDTPGIPEDSRQKWEKMDCYFDGDKLVRVQTYPHQGISNRTEEFYFTDGKLVFAAINDKGLLLTEGNDQGIDNKEFYFDNDKLIKYDNKTKEPDKNIDDTKKMYEAKLINEAKDYLDIIPNENITKACDNIQKFRTDIESKLKANKLTRKVLTLDGADISADTRQKWEKMDCYFDGDKLVRIQTYPHKGISSRTEEFYFNGGKLVFVAINDKGLLITEGNDQGTDNKEFCFDNDKLIKYVNKTKEHDRNYDDEIKMYELKLIYEAKDYLDLSKNAK